MSDVAKKSKDINHTKSVKNSESGKDSEESLADFDVVVIDGIDKQISKKLRAVNILCIRDLVNANANTVSKEINMPLHKFAELQKKAELVLDLTFDEDILNSLGSENYTIEQAVEEDIKKLMKITKQDTDKINDFQEKIRQIVIYLDTATTRNTSIKMLPRTKPIDERSLKFPHILWVIELILIGSTIGAFTISAILAGILVLL